MTDRLAGEGLLEGGAEAVLAEILARARGDTPEWRLAPGGDWDAARGPGAALARVGARYVEVLGQRFSRAVGKRELAFLGLAGVRLIPPRGAKAPVAFRLADNAPDSRIPAGTRLTSPGAGSSSPLAFETESTVAVSSAKLVEVVSFWPGRDQYIDHSADLAAKQPTRLFRKADLINTPHALYLAHDRLLALTGKVALNVGIEFLTPGSPALSLVWEYWDGKVWRAFKDLGPPCSLTKRPSKDGTQGFTQTGPILLETDFAETGKTTVNGVESHWIRVRLDAPLPAGGSRTLPTTAGREAPAEVVQAERILPEIDVIDLSLQIQRPLPAHPPTAVVDPAARALATTAPAPAPADPDATDPIAGKFVPDLGLPLDKAFADRVALDVSKTFSPFGAQPHPGATFYWMIEEVMAKPGAVVTVEFRRAVTPQHRMIEALPQGNEQLTGLKIDRTTAPLDARIVWEYWDGRGWSALELFTLAGPGLDTRGEGAPRGSDLFLPAYGDGGTLTVPPLRVGFRVPADAAATVVNAVSGRWLRVRLASGGFGATYMVKTTSGPAAAAVSQTTTSVFIDPPALEDVRVGYLWEYGPFPPERVFTYNDFQYVDETDDTLWEGGTFPPFRPPGETNPSVYLGFDKAQPQDRIGVHFDVVEDPAEDRGPPLAWEYWDGFTWKELLSAVDGTRGLRVPGIVDLLGPADSAAMPRFGTSRHWIRARLRDDSPPGEPAVGAITPNAVVCVQRETITNEPLGIADGRPDLTLTFRRVPVLDGEWVEVRESSGTRAGVDWRIVAREVAQGSERLIRDLEAALAVEGTTDDPESGGVRLRRDRLKRVTEVWVRWSSRPHLLDSRPGDRHYAVERSRGTIAFGDGLHGKVPPAGAAVQARRYQTGGGSGGNVTKGAINQAAASISGLEKVESLRAAEGGADGETLAQARDRGPAALRNRGRALLRSDYEELAREASASVARAWAIFERDGSGRPSPRPGGVTIQVLPRADPVDPRPWPSFGLRETVRAYLALRASASVAGSDRIHVTGPTYFPIDVEATLAPRRADDAGTILDKAKLALRTFLHPVVGGRDGAGWRPETPLHASDVAAALAVIQELDHVESLALLIEGSARGDVIEVPPGRVVCARKITLKLAAAAISEGRSS